MTTSLTKDKKIQPIWGKKEILNFLLKVLSLCFVCLVITPTARKSTCVCTYKNTQSNLWGRDFLWETLNIVCVTVCIPPEIRQGMGRVFHWFLKEAKGTQHWHA